uniref:Uncharacterized protein n=1 Tax=Solanum lycopersicum TaxID=4081 RepID=A0A3Q7GHS1_SOLLC
MAMEVAQPPTPETRHTYVRDLQMGWVQSSSLIGEDGVGGWRRSEKMVWVAPVGEGWVVDSRVGSMREE